VEGTETTGPLDAIQMVDVGEAAQRMGVSVKTVRRLLRRGELDFVKVGRSIRIPVTDIAGYIDAHRNGHAGDAA
jgi:excisionase family DNA binding protein